MKKEQENQNGKIWLKGETRQYRALILFLTFLTVFSTVFSLAFAYTVRYLINSASNGSANLLWKFAILLLAMLFLRISLKTLSSFFAERLRAKMTSELRTNMFATILRSDYANIQPYHSGDLLNRLTSDIQQVVGTTVGFAPAIAEMIVQCVGAIVALLTIDPLFTAVYVVCGVIFGGITALFRKQLKKRQKAILQADGEFRSFMHEGLTSMITLKAYSAEDKSIKRASCLAENYFQKRMDRNYIHTAMSFIFSMLSNFGLILAVVWCSVSVLNGNDDYGSILSVILLLMQLQHPFASFSSLIPAYYGRLASGERLAEIQNISKEMIAEDNTNVCEIYQQLHSISLENLSFSYGRDSILQSANGVIHKGEIVCLTGASGAGKSTLFKLLLNVYVQSEGNIYLCDTQGEKRVLTAKERGLFAYVPQGNFLFSGTIYENLTFFTNDSLDEQMQTRITEALKIACAEFVWDLPDGLQTVLSEGGEGLSEGQLQRLAIARAILSERSILLLDEATSALDSKTEKRVLENIRNLQDKTCLIVTHRPAALAIADCVFNMEKGKINITK